MKSLIFCFLIFSGMSAFAQECLDSQELTQIQKQFKITVDRTGRDYRCDPENFNYKIAEALIFAKGLDFSGPEVPNPWSQEILQSDWVAYVRERSRNIKGGLQDPWTPNKCKNDEKPTSFTGAYVYHEIPDTMFMCGRSFGPEQSVIARLSTLLHEARHHDGHGHVPCAKGLFKGQMSCDQKISNKGSYAVDVEGYSKLAVQVKNIHPSLKKMSLSYALEISDRFNQSFKNVTPYSFLTDLDGNSFRFNGKSLIAVQKGILPQGHFFFRNTNELIVFPFNPEEKAQRFQVNSGLEFSPLPDAGTVMIDYNKYEPSKRQTFKDRIFYFSSGKYDATVYDDTLYLIAFNQNQTERKDYVITGPWGEVVKLFTAKDLSASKENRVYILDHRNEMFRIEYTLKSYEITVISNPVPNMVSITSIGQEKFGLDQDGRLHKKIDGEFQIFPPYKDLRFKSLSGSSDFSPEEAQLMTLSE